MVNNKTRKRIFKKKDYLSGDGMLTSVWGPSMWHFLHIMSFNYPINPTPEDKSNYRNFILNIELNKIKIKNLLKLVIIYKYLFRIIIF